MMTLERADFRLRKVGYTDPRCTPQRHVASCKCRPTGYRVAQRVGGGWELLSPVYPTKADAVSYIRAILHHD